nr:unnamed protein product [Spirometra erinaceieuropaei]
MTVEVKGRIVQVTNISPTSTMEQMRTLFGHIGVIEDIVLYPPEKDDTQTKVCFVKYADVVNAEVSLHLNNTIFLDRALIVLPLVDGRDTIPDENYANLVRAPPHTAAGVLPRSANWPLDVISMVVGRPGEQAIHTIEPRLATMGFPSYPPLPAATDVNRIEEIRRTVFISNLSPKTTGEEVLEFFNAHAEVKCVRMAGTDEDRAAYVEFTEQPSVVKAFGLMGATIGDRQIMVQHSNCAIIKPASALLGLEDTAKKTSPPPNPVLKEVGRFVDRRRSRSRSKSRDRSRRSRSYRSSRRSRSRSPRRSRNHRSSRHRRSRSRRHYSRSPSRDRRRDRSRSRVGRRSRRSRSPSDRRPRHSRSRSRARRERRERDARRRSHSRDRDRTRRGRDRSKDRDRSRERDREKSKDKDRERSRERVRERSRDKYVERSREKDSERSKEKGPEPAREKERERSRDKDLERSRDRERERSRDKDGERSREKDHDRPRERERGRSRERDRSRMRDKERERDRDSSRGRRRDRSRDRDRERERDKTKGRTDKSSRNHRSRSRSKLRSEDVSKAKKAQDTPPSPSRSENENGEKQSDETNSISERGEDSVVAQEPEQNETETVNGLSEEKPEVNEVEEETKPSAVPVVGVKLAGPEDMDVIPSPVKTLQSASPGDNMDSGESDSSEVALKAES